MPKEVELPDGSIGEFPDEMGDDEIAAVLKKQFPPHELAGAVQEAPAPTAPKPKPPSLPEASFGVGDVLKQVPAALPEAPGQLLNYGKGLLKGAGRMVARGADQALDTPLGLPVPGAGALQALTGLDRQKRIARLDEILGLAPKGAAQEVGGAVSEAIPYFMPTSGAGALSKGAGALSKMVLEAGKAASISRGLQGATPGEAAIAGGLGGLGQGITSAGEAVVPGLRASASTLFQKAIQPTRQHLKAAVERIAPEAVNRGISGSLPEITKEAAGHVSELSKHLESVYDAATAQGVTFDATALAMRLDALKGRFHVLGKGGGTIRPQSEAAIEAVKERILAQGATITPRDLWETRKALDEIISGATGAGFDVPRAGVRGAADRISKGAGKLLQDELNAVDPALKGLNKEFGFWNDLLKGAKATTTRRVGQEGSLGARLVGSVIGGAIGAATGQDYQSTGIGLLAGAAGGQKALELMRTPAFRTASAQVQKHVANLIEAGRVDDAVVLLGRLVGRGLPGQVASARREFEIGRLLGNR